jgi:putative lipoprotein
MRAVLLVPLAALSACQTADGPSRPAVAENQAARVTLNGTVSYRQRIALPQDARLKVTISDVSLMDVAAPVIAEIETETAGRQVPISFALDYDAARVKPGRSYAVSARIVDASGKLLWITDTRFDLPAPGTPADLMLVQVTG